MKKVTVKEMVKAYLKMNGYTGLVGDGCGCEISDLMPCEAEGIPDCEAGYKHLCNKCPVWKNCEIADGQLGNENWCISVSRDAPKEATNAEEGGK